MKNAGICKCFIKRLIDNRSGSEANMKAHMSAVHSVGSVTGVGYHGLPDFKFEIIKVWPLSQLKLSSIELLHSIPPVLTLQH